MGFLCRVGYDGIEQGRQAFVFGGLDDAGIAGLCDPPRLKTCRLPEPFFCPKPSSWQQI